MVSPLRKQFQAPSGRPPIGMPGGAAPTQQFGTPPIGGTAKPGITSPMQNVLKRKIGGPSAR